MRCSGADLLVPGPGIKVLLPSVPSDQLAALLARARSAVERFFIALVAVHALPGSTIRQLLQMSPVNRSVVWPSPPERS
ncbi:hypothetical protein [Streptomyces virginiae]|uniref:hypothetical protein n=1 Tax=Streptomyces virginiae TaxID=1961 RepID=UPI003243E60F